MIEAFEFLIDYIFARMIRQAGKVTRKEVISLIVATIISLLCQYSIPNFAPLIQTPLSFFCLWFIFGSFFKSFASYSYVVVFFKMVGQVEIAAFGELQTTTRAYIYKLLAVLVCSFAISYLRYWTKKRSKENPYWVFLDRIVLIFGILLHITTSVSITLTLQEDARKYAEPLAAVNFWFFVLYLIVFVAVVIVFIRTIIRQIQLDQDKANAESMRRYNEIVESSSRELRKFKHDYANVMLGMTGYLEEGDYEGLRKYYYDQVSPTVKELSASDFHLDRLVHIDCPPVKAVLAEKLVTANGKGIKVNLELSQDISGFYIQEVDLVRMLGIILDNAIEELESLGSGSLTLAIFKRKSSIDIIVQNNTRPKDISIRDIKEEGFSTKGNNRGYGLSNLQELVDKYPNALLQTHITDDLFTQHLTLMEV